MMRYFNWIGGILMAVLAIWLVYAVNTYSDVPQNEYVKEMVDHLEKTYDEKFVVEEYIQGSKLFPKFLGSDMIRVHPKRLKDLAFYTLLTPDRKGVEDFYVEAYYSHAFTLKYQEAIKGDDKRDMYVQIHVQNPLINGKTEILKQPMASVVQDFITPEMVYAYVVVAVDNDFVINDEAALLARTYKTIKEATGSDFIMNVNYIYKKQYEEAIEMTRSGHAYSVDLSMLPEGFYGKLIFENSADARDEAYFKDYLSTYY